MNDNYCSHGPVSTLPGSTTKAVPEGTMCDDHPEVKATRRVQGETDSFGCEYIFMCEACFTGFQETRRSEENKERSCDWCKQVATSCRPHRDLDEGMSGRVYLVCGACRTKELEALLAEDDADDSWDDADVFDDDDDDDYVPDDDYVEIMLPVQATQTEEQK